MNSLAEKSCTPAKKSTPKLDLEARSHLLEQLSEGWIITDSLHLQREYSFDNFVQALEFTNQLGALAESEGHHPDIFLAWGKVRVDIWTHAVNGLTESDFILAAKIDANY